MHKEWLSRTEMLFGEKAMEQLEKARVAVFGIGGVGGHAAEALVRSGIGRIELIDNDVVAESNINRQLIATRKDIGRPKVEVMAERLKDIAPECEVVGHRTFFLPETDWDFSGYDYVVDAIDTVSAKVDLVVRATRAGVPVISSMGAGNKLNPTMFRVADLCETKVDPLAKVMRRELKKYGISHCKVVYSAELPMKPMGGVETIKGGTRIPPGSNAFVPSAVGLILASEVVKDITGIRNDISGV